VDDSDDPAAGRKSQAFWTGPAASPTQPENFGVLRIR